jgi:hypothetical protein
LTELLLESGRRPNVRERAVEISSSVVALLMDIWNRAQENEERRRIKRLSRSKCKEG